MFDELFHACRALKKHWLTDRRDGADVVRVEVWVAHGTVERAHIVASRNQAGADGVVVAKVTCDQNDRAACFTRLFQGGEAGACDGRVHCARFERIARIDLN